ncbi:hypothetical protein [Herbaspirillum sp. ST 5-3]|uniref:hypothetical protein n=1 Tax=Oxalobacteraceae TaxID=75682 RepID=UPI0010A3FE2A|nr:hypothetical protein [Herbaspirillum sp. ST 5-3]
MIFKKIFQTTKNAVRNEIRSIVGTVKNTAGVEAIKQNHNYFKQMASLVLTPKKYIENARKETFEQAVQRHGVTDEDLKKNYNNFVITFYVSVVFALACAGVGLGYVFDGNLLGAVSALTITTVCLANAFKFSFRAFQIKHRSLCAVSDFMQRKSEWIPLFAK